MTRLLVASAAALLFLLASGAGADTLSMQPGYAISDDGRPTRGMTQQRVQAKYGQPQSTRAPVGDPPISRWEYADFIVYFEHDKVIHAVTKR